MHVWRPCSIKLGPHSNGQLLPAGAAEHTVVLFTTPVMLTGPCAHIPGLSISTPGLEPPRSESSGLDCNRVPITIMHSPNAAARTAVLPMRLFFAAFCRGCTILFSPLTGCGWVSTGSSPQGVRCALFSSQGVRPPLSSSVMSSNSDPLSGGVDEGPEPLLQCSLRTSMSSAADALSGSGYEQSTSPFQSLSGG